MVDKRIVVNMLALISYHTTITEAFATLSLENKVEHIASNSIMQCYDIVACT